MKKIFVVVGFLVLSLVSGFNGALARSADSTGVVVLKNGKFMQYKVEAHEGWYSIARKTGIAVADLREANKELGDTLKINEIVLVPISIEKSENHSKPENITKDVTTETKGEPVFHTLKPKETIYSISKKYQVTADELKQWNQLSPGGMKAGDQLIVGYKPVKGKPGAAKMEEKKPVLNSLKTEHAVKEETPKVKPETKADTATRVKSMVVETKVPADSQNAIPKTYIAKNRHEVSEQGVATWIEDENINPNKYFALHRTASTGSIVKVTNRMNRRAVFVKVVGKLPDTGDNENVIIKISKASAEKLGVRDQRFQCELSYGVTEK